MNIDTLSQQVSDESVSLKSEKQVMKTDLNSDSSSDERSFDDKSENRVLHTMINEQMQPEGVFEAFDVQPKYTSVNTTDIIRQIVDQISIAKTTGESVIEMQLNPENLGKLYINVTERNSEITARIAVSNETVKNALESQMAALRENLQDANINNSGSYSWHLIDGTADSGEPSIMITDQQEKYGWYTNPDAWKNNVILKPKEWGGSKWTFEKQNVTTGISAVAIMDGQLKKGVHEYNLLGIPVTRAYRGIVVRSDGKKISR